MPPAIPAIAGAAAAYGISSALTGTVIGAAIGGFGISLAAGIGGAVTSSLVSGLIGSNDNGSRPTSQGYLGRTETIRQAVAPQRMLYGRARFAGVRTFAHAKPNAAGRPNGLFYVLDTFTGHELDAVEELWVGDTRATDTKFTGKFRYSINRGRTTQSAHPLLVEETEGKWTAEHRQRGWSSVAAEFTYDDSLWDQGIPSLRILARGVPDIWDPRTGTTGWSNNSALIVADYLRKPWGLGEPDDAIDEAVLIEAANLCDEVVPTLIGAEPRYRTNGLISLDQAPKDILAALLAPCAGELVYSGGVWRVLPGAYRPATYSFGAQHLRGEIGVTWRRSRRDLTNVVRGVIVRPGADWQEYDLPELRDEAAIAEDGGTETVLDLDLGLCTSGSQGQRVMAIAHKRQRLQRQAQVPLNLYGLVARAGDTLTFGAGRLEPQEWRCTSWRITEEGGVDLVLVEESASVYAWSVADEKPLQPAGTISTTADAYATPAPTITAPATAAFTTLAVAWTASAGATSYDIEARAAGTQTWTSVSTAATSINRTVADVSEIRVRASGEDGFSSWGAAPIPPTPTQLTVRNVSAGLAVDVPASPGGLARYQVFHGATGTFASATKAASEVLTGSVPIPLFDGVVQNVWIRAVGTAGNVSLPLGPLQVIAGPSGSGGSIGSSGSGEPNNGEAGSDGTTEYGGAGAGGEG